MPNPTRFLFIFGAGALLAFSAWWFWAPEPSPWAVDPDEVTLPPPGWRPAVHLHDVVRSLPADDDRAGLSAFTAAAGPSFAQAYVEDILAIGPADDPATAAGLRTFASHPSIAGSLTAVDTTSGDPDRLRAAEQIIEDAFRRLHAHFPDIDPPQLIWMHSGFNHAVYPTDSTLAVGLEWFLGPDHPIVSSLSPSAFPSYLRDRMDPERMAAEAVRGWLVVHFSKTLYQPETCADALLFWGKVLFLVDQILPTLPNPIWFDWSSEEWAWAEANERAVWLEMSQQDVLFNANAVAFSRWFTEGPFTRAAAIPQESPDRLGAYLGWRIVSDYAEQNVSLSLPELLRFDDSGQILSAYRK